MTGKSISVGITGQPGFIGSHLYNHLGLSPEKYTRIPCKDEFFEDSAALKNFVGQCDTIVHLAAMNRHGDPNVIYETNLKLVKKLIDAAESLGHFPQIIFSSSTQEELDNLYGKSKRDGRILFENFAQKHQSVFNGFVIPNVFGAFGRPYYNSVISTFSHQLTHGETPRIDVDKELKLIYVTELVNHFIEKIGSPESNTVHIPHTSESSVTTLLKILEGYKEIYFENNMIPQLNNAFEVALFNTFRSYINYDHRAVKLKKHTDDRGYLVETIKEFTGGQSFFSYTVPGITRGNHFHTRKVERFCVLQGEALIKMRRIGTEQIYEYRVSGNEPVTVDMPIYHTHNITNVGDTPMLTSFWTNEIFNPNDSDTYFEVV